MKLKITLKLIAIILGGSLWWNLPWVSSIQGNQHLAPLSVLCKNNSYAKRLIFRNSSLEAPQESTDRDITNPFRFPTLHKRLLEIIETYPAQHKISLVLIGPGSIELENGLDEGGTNRFSPQAIEIISLFSGRPVEMTVIDVSTQVLEAIKNIRYYQIAKGCLQFIRKTYAKSLLDKLIKKLLSIMDISDSSYKKGIEDENVLRVNPLKIKNVSIDTLHAKCEHVDYGEEEVDIVVATISSVYGISLGDRKQKKIRILGKFVRALKPGGKLLIDFYDFCDFLNKRRPSFEETQKFKTEIADIYAETKSFFKELGISIEIKLHVVRENYEMSFIEITRNSSKSTSILQQLEIDTSV